MDNLLNLIVKSQTDALPDIKYRIEQDRVQFYDKDGYWLVTVRCGDTKLWIWGKYQDPKSSTLDYADSSVPNTDVAKIVTDRIIDTMNKQSEGFIQK